MECLLCGATEAQLKQFFRQANSGRLILIAQIAILEFIVGPKMSSFALCTAFSPAIKRNFYSVFESGSLSFGNFARLLTFVNVVLPDFVRRAH